MASVNWNDTFLTQPDDENNPGRGAEEIRDTRVGINERIAEDHFIGQNDELVLLEVGGTHREGTARALVDDEFDVARDTSGERVLRQNVGSLRVNMDLLGSGNWRTQAEVDLDTEDAARNNRKKSIQLYFTDADAISEFVTIFDPDAVVSTVYDQSISGDKVFTRAVEAPADDDTAAVAAVEADFNPNDALYDTDYVIPANVFWQWMHDAKFHNLFDSSSSDNTTLLSASTGIHGVNYIDKDLSANVITAEKVYGAVYS